MHASAVRCRSTNICPSFLYSKVNVQASSHCHHEGRSCERGGAARDAARDVVRLITVGACHTTHLRVDANGGVPENGLGPGRSYGQVFSVLASGDHVPF